jgi:radical SAM superfamily enzyme YgiQ (UPF0313 family)
MKIALISVDEPIYANGIRSISSYLKENGHGTRLIFLPYGSVHGIKPRMYPSRVLNELMAIVKDSRLIGISSMTLAAGRAIQVIGHLRSLDIPLVWGGIHPTTCPEECIEHVGAVCVGEGERAMLELAEALEKGERNDIKNFWFKREGKIIKNEVRPYIEDLDRLPFADYDFSDQYVLDNGKIVRMHERFLNRWFLIHTSRGCPYTCTYCCNRFVRDLYRNVGETKHLRTRSIKNVIDELAQAKQKFRSLNNVWFTDDEFFARPFQELETFRNAYKSEINLPFQCYVNPNTLSETKLNLFVDAGLRKIEMGIQSGSEHINFRVYKRFTDNETIVKAAKILNKCRWQIEAPNYQFIIANPYEKEGDVLQTIELVSELSQPYNLETFGLALFPGVELFEMARKDGVVKTKEEACYDVDYFAFTEHLKRKKTNVYLNALLFWMQGQVTATRLGAIPRSILPILLNKRVIALSYRLPYVVLFMNRAMISIRYVLRYLKSCRRFIHGSPRAR